MSNPTISMDVDAKSTDGKQPQSAARVPQITDYSAIVATRIPEIQSQLKSGVLSRADALEQLLALEKKARLVADAPSTAKLALAIVTTCRDEKQWGLLNEHITLLCKRRAQLQKTIETVVQASCKWIEETPDDTTKRALIETLRDVSEGKIFIELERGRITRTLAGMEEKAGNVSKAAEILQEVQVETIGSMDIREKAEFLLEQIRLCLVNKDYIRAIIIRRKVNTEVLEQADMQDLKVKFYQLMIEYYLHEKEYFEVAKAYRAIYNTKSIQDDEMEWRNALKNAVIFFTLAPFDSEVSDSVHRLLKEKRLALLENEHNALTLLSTAELIDWPLKADKDWQLEPVFDQKKDPVNGKERYELLHKRIVQHNMRTIAGYYDRVTSARFAALVGLSEEKAELYLSELVSSKQLFAKIDRPSAIINFVPKQSANAVMNTWASDISSLLNLVERTCHLINKENMVHRIKSNKVAAAK